MVKSEHGSVETLPEVRSRLARYHAFRQDASELLDAGPTQLSVFSEVDHKLEHTSRLVVGAERHERWRLLLQMLVDDDEKRSSMARVIYEALQELTNALKKAAVKLQEDNAGLGRSFVGDGLEPWHEISER